MRLGFRCCTGHYMNRSAGMLVVTFLLALCSCATEPETVPPVSFPVAPAEVAVLAVSSRIEEVAVTAIDMDTVKVLASLVVANKGTVAVDLESHAWSATAGEDSLTGYMDAAGGSLEPGGEISTELVLKLDSPPGTDPLIKLRVEIASSCRSNEHGSIVAVASYETSFPRIMPPTLNIVSIRILKDELINTRLGVDMAVHNPNAFNLDFSTLEYRLYGEGKYWASGNLVHAFTVPALMTVEAGLYLSMNFADMDRSLLDRVIKLAKVNYRLSGVGLVDTGLDFLPRFELPFDLSGAVNVR